MSNAAQDSAATGKAASLVPLSSQRIGHALEAQGWSYTVDADGDIGGGWEYGSFYFFTGGDDDEVLSVRGSWRGQLDPGEFVAAVEVCNEWNAERLWPKTYARRDESGMVRFHTEHNVDFEHGLSDAQLDQQVVCAVDTGIAFYERLNERFPATWEKYRPAP